MSEITLALVVLTCILVAWIYSKIGLRGLILLAIVGLMFITGSFVFLHTLITSDKVATVQCTEVTNDSHQMIMQLNGTAYTLGGDMWMLQGSTLEVQPYLYGLGIKSAHDLTRLGSEYSDPTHATAKPIGLGGTHFENMPGLLMLPIIRSSYQSAVIEPCDGREYVVTADVNGDLSAERV